MTGIGHQLLAEGRVQLRVPAGGILTDAEARRLAWALLSDLDPDEVVPFAQVVSVREGKRLAVLRAIASGARTATQITATQDWGNRLTQRLLADLVDDGRVVARGAQPDRHYRLRLPRAAHIESHRHTGARA